jgi:aspartate-semialdehyde dehydrogenase
MANTTFSGPVRSENGFESITKNATTGVITVNSSYGNVVVASTQALSGAGAANITTAITECTATATGNVVTLANGVAVELVKQLHSNTTQQSVGYY